MTTACDGRSLRWAGGLLVAVLGASSCSPRRAWRPPPGAVLAPAPGKPIRQEPAVSTARSGGTSPADDRSAAAVSAELPAASDGLDRPPVAPVTAPAIRVFVALETPYKLGQRPVPETRAAQEAELVERRRWNDGGLGILAAEQPPPRGHPDPRVRVDVAEATGRLTAAAVQRTARRYHWINVVRCYRLGAYRAPTMRGWTWGRLSIGGTGQVRSTRLTKTELSDRTVAECLIQRLRKVEFPRSVGTTKVKISIKVSPGDDPLPPPEEEIVPGEGELPVAEMVRGVRAGLGDFEACYREGLEYAPELWGRIPIRFHLTERGVLDEAFDAGSRFPDPRVKQCILRRARTLRFSAPDGGDVRFVVPVRFWTDLADVPGASTALR